MAVNDDPAAAPQSRPPRSATSFALNAVSLATLLVGVYVLRQQHLDTPTSVLILALCTAVPTGLLDTFVLRVWRRESTGLDWSKPFTPSLARVATKLLGLAVTVGVIAAAYWAFPEYHGAFYDPFFRVLRRLAIPLAVAVPAYVWFVDGRMRAPEDAYWQVGRAALGNFADVKRVDVASHARGWLVKAFFLPLMSVYFHGEAGRILSWNLTGATWQNLGAYEFCYSFVFFVDLAFTTIGYVLSLRLTDSHLRSAEPTMFGWVVALFCYQPFFSMFEAQYVAYGGDGGFGGWLARWPTLRIAWALTVIALLVVYVLATVTFGWRFSNLTHRGILTGGPYRFTKHPAYVSKNLSWWMTAVPFATSRTPIEGFRHCLLLFCVNLVYFLRAKTEEKHLSRDPDYVAYALWMNDHGTFRFLGRWFPWLRYAPPSSAARDVA